MKRSTTAVAPRHGGLLEFLQADATAAVLRALLEEHPDHLKEAAALARAQLRLPYTRKPAAGTTGRRGSRGEGGGTEVQTLGSLNRTGSEEVLRSLLLAHPERKADAARIARPLMPRNTREEVASVLERKLRSLERRDLYEWMDGSNLLAYDSLSELSCELLESEVDPFVSEMERRAELGLAEEARVMFEGVLIGLYRLRVDVSTDVLGLADDFPEASAEDMVRARRDSIRNSGEAAEFPAEFVASFLPEWKKFLERVWAKVD